MSQIAEKIKIAQDKDGMLRRALERIIQLYTDRSHFVYELLQNAEDAGATNITFTQYDDRLEVMHNGKPFTRKNLEGLCDIGKSDKINDLNQIGEFGVGFKSVFSICDTVQLYSNPLNYKGEIGDAESFAININDFTNPQDIQPSILPNGVTTKFVFPYTVGKTFSGYKTTQELKDAISKKLQNLGITTLLFMKNLQVITYKLHLNDGAIKEGQYLLEEKRINEHCSIASAIGLNGNNVDDEKIEEVSYLKFSRKIDTISNRTVDIAFPIQISENGIYECKRTKAPHISVYFPTETESKLGFIVQGPYRTTPNRSSIPADNEDNIKLAHETAVLLRDSLIELRDSKKLNLSFIKALPLNSQAFETYNLFMPIYDMVKKMLSEEEIIPTRNSGFAYAKNSKIARQEKLANLFNDIGLTKLISDGSKHFWLPTNLTETNKEYEAVHRYFVNELKIGVIRPEDLRIYFANNRNFLKEQNDDWLVELYSIFENVPAAFSKAKYEVNLLTSEIIKTTTGEFVAPYRRLENKQYISNVFLPSQRINSPDIHFVDPAIYQRCRYFFDNILQIKAPNEYEFLIKDIERRYGSDAWNFDKLQHINDIKFIIKYLKIEDYKPEVERIINSHFAVLCRDGRTRNTNNFRIYTTKTATGIDIETYFSNVINNLYYVDVDFYTTHGISFEMLSALGVRTNITIGEDDREGIYNNGIQGRQPMWYTVGSFRWKFNIERIRDVLDYISTHPHSKDSILKSKIIFSILSENEDKLVGTVQITGNTQNLTDERCELLKEVRGDTIHRWNKKWVYTESGDIAAIYEITKYDISTAIYGKLKSESSLCSKMGFKISNSDLAEGIVKALSPEHIDALLELELRKRYGIGVADIERYMPSRDFETSYGDSPKNYEFPVAKVKNWEALKKHVAEVLCFANPVKYDQVIRQIRISNKPREARAYLQNMYRYDGTYYYACQMCHKATTEIEATQIFNNNDYELDAMHLCLCPNCHAKYVKLRNKMSNYDNVMTDRIMSFTENEISSTNQMSISIEGNDIWFTQTHFAEIQSLLKMSKEALDAKNQPISAEDLEEGETIATDVYKAYIGKKLRKKKDGQIGEIISVDKHVTIKILEGPESGNTKSYVLSVLRDVERYEII